MGDLPSERGTLILMLPNLERTPTVAPLDGCSRPVFLALDVASYVIEDYFVSCFGGRCDAQQGLVNMRHLSRNRMIGTSFGHGGEILLALILNEATISDLVPHIRSCTT